VSTGSTIPDTDKGQNHMRGRRGRDRMVVGFITYHFECNFIHVGRVLEKLWTFLFKFSFA
jgi:hypothetical protein